MSRHQWRDVSPLFGAQTAAVAQMAPVVRRSGLGIYIESKAPGEREVLLKLHRLAEIQDLAVRFETVSKVRGKHAFRAGQFYIVA